MQTEIFVDVQAETATEKLYDLCLIEQLCRGNQEQVKEMIEVFIEETPRAVEDIKSAYKKNDFAVIKTIAHRIKPLLSYYAIIKIEKDIQLIEAMAAEGVATNELQQKIQKMDDLLTLVVEQMKKSL